MFETCQKLYGWNDFLFAKEDIVWNTNLDKDIENKITGVEDQVPLNSLLKMGIQFEFHLYKY